MGAYLVFNQENVSVKCYAYFPNGNKKAILVHILNDSTCPCKYEELPNHYIDGKNIYKKL